MSFVAGVDDCLMTPSFEIWEDTQGELPSFAEKPHQREIRRMPMTLRDPTIMKQCSKPKKRVLKKNKKADTGKNVLRSRANALGNHIKKASAVVVSSLGKFKPAPKKKKENVSPQVAAVVPVLESPLSSMRESVSSDDAEDVSSTRRHDVRDSNERYHGINKSQAQPYPHAKDVFSEDPHAHEKRLGLSTIEEKVEISPCGLISLALMEKSPRHEVEDILLRPRDRANETGAEESHEFDSSMDESHVSLPSDLAGDDHASSPLLKRVDLSPPTHISPALSKMAQYLQTVMTSKSQSASLHRSSSWSSSSSEDQGSGDAVGDYGSQGEYEGSQRMESLPKRRLRELSDATQEIFNASNQSFHSAQGCHGDDPVKSATPTKAAICPNPQITLSKLDVEGAVKDGGTAKEEEERDYSIILGGGPSSGPDRYGPPFMTTDSFDDTCFLSTSTVRAIPGSPGPAIRQPTAYAQARALISRTLKSPDPTEPLPRMGIASSSCQRISEVPSYPLSSSSSIYHPQVRRRVSTVPSVIGSNCSSAGWEKTDPLEEKDLPDSLLAEKRKSVKERVKELDMAIDQGLKFRNTNERNIGGGGGGKEGFFLR